MPLRRPPQSTVFIQVPLPNGRETIDRIIPFDIDAPPTLQALLKTTFEPVWRTNSQLDIYGYVKEFNSKYNKFVDLESVVYAQQIVSDGDKFQFWYTIDKMHPNVVLIYSGVPVEDRGGVLKNGVDVAPEQIRPAEARRPISFGSACSNKRNESPEIQKAVATDSSEDFEFVQIPSILAPPKRGEPKADDDTATIVLLGETGVGKSTLINGIVNYLAHASLSEAAASPRFLIPAAFQFESKWVAVGGEDENEELENVGQSATQRPRTYEFSLEGANYRIIDVPGIGDSRGAGQDRTNFDYILEEINKHAKINAFCILMPSDMSKITVATRYCLNELLANLHKDAARNIVFCFTKARATFYRSGETLRSLVAYLEQLKAEQGVEIKLNKNTMYYFDNEAFKYLCLQQHGIRVGGGREEYEKSFSVSKASTERLFAYVRSLAPHDTTAMAALTEARRLILHMVPISAETSKKIRMNANALEAEIENLKLSRRQGKNLEEHLMLTEFYIEATALEMPRTVCAGQKCIKLIPVPNSTEYQTLYPQICHSACRLTAVRANDYPNPALKECAVFDKGVLTNCTICGCSWRHHLHLTHLQKLRRRKVVNRSLQTLLANKSAKEMTMEDVIESYQLQMQQLDEDEARIKRMCAMFSTFLRNNSLSIRNDVYADYLRHAADLAEQEMLLGGSKERVSELKRSLRAYEEEVKLLQEAATLGEVITIDDIHTLKQDLLELTKRHQEIGALLCIADGEVVRPTKNGSHSESSFQATIPSERVSPPPSSYSATGGRGHSNAQNSVYTSSSYKTNTYCKRSH